MIWCVKLGPNLVKYLTRNLVIQGYTTLPTPHKLLIVAYFGLLPTKLNIRPKSGENHSLSTVFQTQMYLDSCSDRPSISLEGGLVYCLALN